MKKNKNNDEIFKILEKYVKINKNEKGVL